MAAKKKKLSGVSAVIEFSSNNLRMIVAERGRDNGVKVLDFMERPLHIGKDTYTTGKLDFDKVSAACMIIKNFITAAQSYGAGLRDMHLIATSALREAENKNYILDQVRLKTGLCINILDGQEEKLNIFKSAIRLLEQDKNPALLAFLGSGNVGFSIVENGRIPFYQSVRIGPLRISELFDDISRRSKEYHLVVKEFVGTYLNKKTVSFPAKVTRLILTGGDINAIKHLCGTEEKNGLYRIKKADFDNLFEQVKDASTETIVRDLKIPLYRAEMLIPALVLAGSFFGLTGMEEAEALPTYLNESILYRALYPKQALETDKVFYRNTLLCVKTIAAKYDVNEAHAMQVESFAMKIYDKIRKLHGMGARGRALLQCASHLHDCGKFVGITDHETTSYNIVRDLDILGFNQQEMRILSMICLLHSTPPPHTYNSFHYMQGDEKTVTAKLAAILRLADALDRGGSQKIKDIEVRLEDECLIIHAATSHNIELEKWAFDIKGSFFGEVFGIKAVMKVRTKL